MDTRDTMGMVLIQNRKMLSGFAIKRIAVICMIIDHIGGIIMDGVIAPYQVDGTIYFTADMPFMVRNAFVIRGICNTIGYIAFPLFCFLIVEGFIHTRNQMRYGIRMFFFAILSEVPYDIAHYQTFFSYRLQNVMFTLCIGIFTLIAIDRFKKKPEMKKNVKITCIVITIAIGMGLALLVRSEYVCLGVLAICLLYLFRDKGWIRLFGFAPLLIVSPWILPALIPVLFYNEQRGKGSKYFFYIFYPAHLMMFAIIASILSNRVI